ncbi:MAG TPA: FAD-dependent monooxygenase [Candidatus Methylomirabilis sp.]|nr:FAD-dependent monooxygenase [Candidatus Methylomirabilis sp.]
MSNTVMGATPVLVVGAGPTGLTMACELARRGVPVRIVDKRAAIDPYCRATTIHSRTLEIFHDLGIVDEILEQGQRFVAYNEYANGRRLSRRPTGQVDSPYPFTISLEQFRTEAILAALLGRLGVVVERCAELVALAEHPDGVAATLRHGDGREEAVAVPWLVGCDGAHSTVRHLIHQSFPGMEDSHRFVQGDVIVAGPVAGDEGYAFLCDTGVLYLFPLPQRRTLVAADLPQHHDDAKEPPSVELFQRLMAERGPAGTSVTDARSMAYFRIHYRLVPHYRHGRRIFLAGDAAHVHSPAGGLGMNTGIQDAYNLAWKLALVAQGMSPHAVLESYEAERRAVAKDVITMSRVMTDRSEAFSHLSQAERECIYVNVVVPEAEARHLAEHLEALDLDYRKSPICGEHGTLRRLGGGPGPGAEARDAGPLQLGDRQLTLFELLRGPHHTMLVFPGARTGPAGWLRLARLAASIRQPDGAPINVHLMAHAKEAVPSDLPAATSIVLDLEGALHRRYDARAECLYLIRPDGYIGYRSAPADARHLRQYLACLFVRAQC